jgi:hypothetical protein
MSWLRSRAMPALITACAAAVIGAAPTNSSVATHVIVLQPQSSAGIHGTATLVPLASKTRVIVVLSDDPPGAVHPSHIHSGTCTNFDPLPAYPLNDVVNGKAVTVVNAPLASLLDSGLVLEVHSSKYHVNIIAACGSL